MTTVEVVSGVTSGERLRDVTRDHWGIENGRHHAVAVVTTFAAAVHANLVDSPKDATRATGKSKTRRLQEGFAAHLRHVARMYPAATNRVVLIDNAPWHAGEVVRAALADLRRSIRRVVREAHGAA